MGYLVCELALEKCGMRNAEWWKIPHSAFHTPHSALD